MLLTMLNVAASNLATPEAQINPFERMLIEPPLIRMIIRNDDAAMDIAQYLDPISLVVGLGFWATRVYGVRTQQLRIAKAGLSSPPSSEPIRVVDEPTNLNNYRMSDDVQNLMGITTIGDN